MGRIGARIGKATETARSAAGKAADTVKGTNGPSPNPMTNIIIADIALRGGGRLIRHAVEKGLLGVKLPREKADKVVSGRSMAGTLIATAVARVATRSVPGALLVGGGLLAKALYDRRKGDTAREEGKAQLERRVQAEPKL